MLAYPRRLLAIMLRSVVQPEPGRPRTRSISPGLTQPWLLSRMVLRGDFWRDSLMSLGMLYCDKTFSWIAASAAMTSTVRLVQVTPSSLSGKPDALSLSLYPTTSDFIDHSVSSWEISFMGV